MSEHTDKAVFVHIGITVSDIDKFVDFYTKYFGFTLERRGVFSSEFIAAAPGLYRQKEGVYSDFAFLVSDNGIALELFQFSDLLPAGEPIWNRPGYHHVCLKVKSVPELYEVMAADGVEFYFEPRPMGRRENAYWVFLKDPDGNMMELQS